VDVLSLVSHHLTHSFGSGEARTAALTDVSLELHCGQLTLLMGPSGSGKSTLLAVLSGLLRPDGGQVVAGGQDVWQLSEVERERFRLAQCGFIFQSYNLFPSLTVREQLEMVVRWGEGLPPRPARRRAAAMLEYLALSGKGHLFPRQLSGGEQQRVAIARALIKEPAFCFADEPTSALDWAHGSEVIALLQDSARQRGTVVLVVAHDYRIVPYADRVYYLEDGRLTRAESAAGQASPSSS
jgi:putative ABC transport system ATP-binding protein